MTQLDMFSVKSPAELKEQARLVKYWKESLASTYEDLARYRKHKFTTGWSFASHAMWSYAKSLYRAKELTWEQLKHFRKVQTWVRKETRREDRYLDSQHSERCRT